ncbi:MAPK protein hog1 [Kappamyces sp. JEL0829]|nr:MAPK protein hog1 [Kappamyces sp. JEL0829]
MTEMIEGEKRPVFPGKDHIDQFTHISQMLGSPPIEVVEAISSASTLKFVKSLEHFDKAELMERFAAFDPEAVDLLVNILVWDPKRRYSAEQALSHPYFSDYVPEEEDGGSLTDIHVEPFDWSFTEDEITCDEWRDRVLMVIQRLKTA